MTTIGNESRPAYVYDADTDTWVPIGVGPHTHDEYIDKTIINAKGDIVVGTAADAVARLGVGPEGSVLIADPTSPTGLAWGEAGGSITVSTTAPEEPGEGDLWFNSTNATTYIYYDGFWVEQSPAIAGPKGEPGVVASASEPSDTDVLWLDTDEEPDVPVPAGGTTGQVLIKSSSDNYDTDWVDPPSGNAIINGAFDFWQRGTSFTGISDGNYSADRFKILFNGTGVRTISRETFTPGAAPISGYEGAFFLRVNQTTAGTGSTFNILAHPIESVRTFAGQTVTLSFFAKANTAKTITARLVQIFGGGGSPSALTLNTSNDISLSTDWERFTFTTTLDSLSGKTLGTDGTDHVRVDVRLPLNDTFTIDIWGVQLEAGTVATPFRRNANSLQGELAACQRYYQRKTGTALFSLFGFGFANSTTNALIQFPLPVEMRVAPTSIDSSTLRITDLAIASAVTSVTLSASSSPSFVQGDFGASGGGLTAQRSYFLSGNNSAAAFVGFSAEL